MTRAFRAALLPARAAAMMVVSLSIMWPGHIVAQQPPPAVEEEHSHHPAPHEHDEHANHEPPGDPHHGHPADHDGSTPALPPFIPPVTDADRAAAFPDVHGHSVHDNAVNSFVLFDHLESQSGSGARGLHWDTRGWIGRDLDRLWFRTEGKAHEGRLEEGHAHLLYGRAVARWWDVVAGVRQDVRPGPAQTWVAIGVQGLAPYWFEVEATAYVSPSGRTLFRLETEYELLLTNRLILQPLVGLEVHGRSDPGRGIGAGLSSGEAGLRLRYEFRREFAPYIGVGWDRRFFGTADHARSVGDRTGGARLALGVRVWR